MQEVRRPLDRDKSKALKEKGMSKSGSSTSINDESLARMMISELAQHNERAMAKKMQERAEYIAIKKGRWKNRLSLWRSKGRRWKCKSIK